MPWKAQRHRGADTELIHLYDLTYTGCTSCFACKLKGGKSYGKCVVNDGLTPVLENIPDAGAIILGSPIYFGTVSGEMKSFMERLLFPCHTYTIPPSSLFGKKIPAAFICTMNVSEQQMREYRYTVHTALNESLLNRMFGHAESFCSFETLQFADYSRVVSSYFDPEERKERRRTVFPKDCKKAFDPGVHLVTSGFFEPGA